MSCNALLILSCLLLHLHFISFSLASPTSFQLYVSPRVMHNLDLPLDCSSAAAAAKSLQSCPTLCDPIHGSPPGFPIPGILQARTLGWAAISFSNVWKWKVKGKSLSHVQLSTTPWTAAYQAPPSMGFSRQEYWSGVPSPSSTIWMAVYTVCIYLWKC